MLFLPESPWFYALKGNDVKAKKALQRIYGSVAGYNVEQEYETIKAEIAAERALSKGASVFEIFRGSNLRRTVAAALAIGTQQVLGTSIYFIFSARRFQMPGVTLSGSNKFF